MKDKFEGLWKRCVVSKQFFALLLVFLMVLSGFSGLIVAQTGQGEGEIRVNILPLLDKYGHPAINADGTFYPNDKFEITYSVWFVGEVVFESIEVSYDLSAFNMINSSSLKSEEGFCFFDVLPSAVAGTYFFCFSAIGSCFSTSENTTISVVVDAVLSVQIVEYDPHFTIALAYTIPSGSGSSYDNPFAFIVRYDGNGPDYNLYQRAIIDDYTWTGYAQKLPETDNLQQTLTPNLTVNSFLNQSSNVQLLTQGLTTKTSQQVLNVDGKNYLPGELPLMFLWETNTNHTYTWTQTLTVDGSGFEWFERQASLTFPPAINPNFDNQTVSQEILHQCIAIS